MISYEFPKSAEKSFGSNLRDPSAPSTPQFAALPVMAVASCSSSQRSTDMFLYGLTTRRMRSKAAYPYVLKVNKLFRQTSIRSGLSDSHFHPLTEAKVVPRVRGVCFYIITAALAILFIFPMLMVHPFVLLFDRHSRQAHHIIAKIWAAFTTVPFLKLEYEGLENLPSPTTPAVYVSNHQSFLDIYALLTLGRNFKFISKTAIFLFPVVGWAMFMIGVIPLKRLDSKSQLDCVKRCSDLIKKGASVFFFPEGTRSRDGELGSFKKGAFSVAERSKVAVVPITLVGTGKIMPAGMEGVVNSGRVKVVVHKPIQGFDAATLSSLARLSISAALPIF